MSKLTNESYVIQINGKSGFSKQTKIIRFTTIVHNLATLSGQITSRNKDLFLKVTKNLAINIRFMVIHALTKNSPISILFCKKRLLKAQNDNFV